MAQPPSGKRLSGFPGTKGETDSTGLGLQGIAVARTLWGEESGYVVGNSLVDHGLRLKCQRRGAAGPSPMDLRDATLGVDRPFFRGDDRVIPILRTRTFEPEARAVP